MKKPYIRKIEKISRFTVWLVDGDFIRDNIDIDFTNFGQHFRFNFIPKNEFWIDRGNADGEERFYIDHLLVEHRLMSQGKSYEEALDQADKKERSVRMKSSLIRSLGKRQDELLMKRLHKALLKKYSRVLKVWIVSGELVRDMFYIDFTEGGHDLVYPFMPKGEIWIDDDVPRKELKFVLLHELHERGLMAEGWPYDSGDRSAHLESNKLEYFCRHHPSKVDGKIKEELGKLAGN
jgi:hypothetical protein